MSPLPPGPRRPPAAQLAAWIHTPEALFTRCQQRYGPTFTLRLLGQPPKVFISDPATIQAVFRGPADALLAGRANAVVEPIVGSTSMLVLDGEAHRAQRRVLSPLFLGRRVRGALLAMVELCEQSVAAFPHGEPFAVLPRFQALTLRIILSALLGVTAGPDLERLFDKVNALMHAAGHPLLMVPALRRHLGPLTPWSRFRALQDAVRAELGERFAQARGEPHREDVIAQLVNQPTDGAPLSDVELADTMLTLLVAGHETSATGLAWAVHHLAHHPDEQEALRTDLTAALGDGPVSLEVLEGIPRLQAVIRETLRLTPPLAQVGRILGEPLELGALALPAGVGVVPCIYLAHRDPEHWPEPERFLPERFLPISRLDSSTYLPFGGGARRCLGESFALHELRVALAITVLRCRLEPVSATRSRVRRRGVVLAPHDGVRVRRMR